MSNDQPNEDPCTHTKKYFIGGLSVNCTQEELENYLLQYGSVTECEIITDKQGKSKGYAFAAISGTRLPADLVSKHHMLLGKLFEIRELVDGSTNSEIIKEISRRKIFLSNLKSSTREEDLSEFFDQFGKVEEVLISRDPHSQQSKGFGFVIFKEEQDASKVLKYRSVKIKNWDVIVKPCLTKQEIQKSKKCIEIRQSTAIPMLPIDMSMVGPGFYPYYSQCSQFFPGGFPVSQPWMYPGGFGCPPPFKSDRIIGQRDEQIDTSGLRALLKNENLSTHSLSFDSSESRLPRLGAAGIQEPLQKVDEMECQKTETYKEQSRKESNEDSFELNRLHVAEKGFFDLEDLKSTAEEKEESSDEKTRDSGSQGIFEYFRRQKRFSSYCDPSLFNSPRSERKSTGSEEAKRNEGFIKNLTEERSPVDLLSPLRPTGYGWFEPLTVSKEKFNRLNMKMKTGLRTLSLCSDEWTEEQHGYCLPCQRDV